MSIYPFPGLVCCAVLMMQRVCFLMEYTQFIHAFFINAVLWTCIVAKIQNKAANLGGLQGHQSGNSGQNYTMGGHTKLQKMFGTYFTCARTVYSTVSQG